VTTGSAKKKKAHDHVGIPHDEMKGFLAFNVKTEKLFVSIELHGLRAIAHADFHAGTKLGRNELILGSGVGHDLRIENTLSV
jgi:hypothetical protein